MQITWELCFSVMHYQNILSKRDQFEELYCLKGFDKALNDTLKDDLKVIRKNLLRNKVKQLFVRIPLIRRMILNS